MKQVTVISGKGGAGKTTVTAMFATLANAVVADCDVDAPNLHILLKPEVIETFHFIRRRVVARLFIFERGAKQFLVKISTLAQISHDWGETSDEITVHFQFYTFAKMNGGVCTGQIKTGFSITYTFGCLF